MTSRVRARRRQQRLSAREARRRRRRRPGGGGGADGLGGFPFIEIRHALRVPCSGSSVRPMSARHAYSPQLPAHITGLTSQPNGSPMTYFTANATQSGGPAFRVQVTEATAVNQATGAQRARPGGGGRAHRRHHQHAAHPAAH